MRLVGQGSDQSEYIITNQMKNAGIATTLGTLSWKHGGMVKCVSRQYDCSLKFFLDQSDFKSSTSS